MSKKSFRKIYLQKLLATVMITSLLFGTLFPTGFATAQVLFSRSGAGISRLPLEVWAFQAPNFGEVVDAINLASGNVYVGTDSLARNNTLEFKTVHF